MTFPKLPDALIETRPCLADDYGAQHPSNGPFLGPVPKRYSRAVHDKICENIRAGNRAHVAAQMAGIPAATFYAWMRDGKNNDPHLWEFAQDVELAYADAEGAAMAVVRDAFADKPEHAKWWLEHGRPDGWSKDVAVKVEAGIGEFMTRLRENLPPEIWHLVIAAAANQELPQLEGPARFKLAPPKPTVEDAETETVE